MSSIARFILVVILVIGLSTCQSDFPKTTPLTDPIDYVDPFIGTGFHGHTFPGAAMPFGMVQLSPDTHLPGWDASSGYHYSDSTIYGFSHTHLTGTGIGDMGDILFLPFTGTPDDNLLAYFSKEDEKAGVGYYQVKLKNYEVLAELTATPRVGIHRYTFPSDMDQQLLIDLGHILQANWGHRSVANKFEFMDDRTIRGERISSGWAYDHRVYFYARFSKPFELVSLSEADEMIPKEATASGKDLKAYLRFPDDDNPRLVVQVGISPVDMEGAKKNLEAEAVHWDFETYVESAQSTWREALGKINIESAYEDVKTNFYTALYHSMLAPMLAQDVDGRYRGMDKQIHQAPEGYTNYTVFSLWDTFRAFHPLMTILDEDHTNAWIRSLLQKYREGGVLPKWPLASNYTGTMVGYPATSVIADALSKGIDDFDQDLALEAMVTSSEYHPEFIERHAEPRAGEVMPKHLEYIQENGFIPVKDLAGSVSYGLECAYYDWCIAQVAARLGRDSIAGNYRDRSTFYQFYFDPASGFMRGKLENGDWREPFSPRFSDHELGDFIEGNSWQWMWFVPHAIPEYIEMMGGPDAFEAKLDSLFTTSSVIEGERASADITGLIGQYAHGNEPSHHVAHLYNYVGAGRKAQERLDQILQEFYLPEPAGIIGNEDCGQMSAWYVLNALGFYQVCPGDPIYSIGRPMVDKATIRLPNGGQFSIVVHNNDKTNRYVQEVQLNGIPLEKPFFEHSAFRDGSVLEFWMSDE